jgi:hypothetical protein
LLTGESHCEKLRYELAFTEDFFRIRISSAKKMKKHKSTISWVEAVESSEIPALIRHAFDFLVPEFGFSLPVADHIGSAVYTFSYRRKNIAIEPLVDRREGDVEVSLVRLENGVRPDTWKIDSKGQLVMVKLFEACWHRKVPSPHASIPANSSGRQQLQLLLAAERETLRNHFDDILHDSDDLFSELNEKRREAKASDANNRVGPKGKLP